ncbi:MAG: late promoter transcription accessory protein [Cetobacterium sp.]|uniref:late promoter transcription accessory protein n=1 Tax=Cetobacterium sp. TaxID=2071632 RepID=UPI003EE635D4
MASASLEIEEIFNRCSETSYLEAVREWTDAKDLDESEVTKYLSDALIQKLTAEAVNANLLKGKKLTSYTLDFLM